MIIGVKKLKFKGGSAVSDRKIALVTGSSSGFGLLTALALAENGCHVIAAMRNLQKKEDLMRKAKQNGVSQRVECRALNVNDVHSIRKIVHEIIENYGRIDVLVNNAGISLGGFVEEVPLEDWRRVMETNFFGMVALTQETLPHMRKAASGNIINIGSVSGRIGFPGYGPYAASKFAVGGFSESLRLEMLPYGVHVSIIEPGAYQTAIWSKGFDYFAAIKKENSPYQNHLDSILNYSKKTAASAGDPMEIAETVVRIVQARRPKFRYVLGKGTKTAVMGKALLPWKWFEQIILHQLEKK